MFSKSNEPLNKGFTIKIPPVNKPLLIIVGVLIVLSTITFFVLKASFKSGMERRIENEVYKRAVKEINKNISGEHNMQDSLLQVIKTQEDKVSQSESRVAALEIELSRSLNRIKKLETGYEKINGRYIGITNDSIRRLYAK